jgi:3-dehydroquinate dehydratase-2
MTAIHILNGPNLNLLGKRKISVYGSVSFEHYFQNELIPSFENTIQLYYYQSNHEGDLIDYLHRFGFDEVGFCFNPGAYAHTSIALADAIEAIKAPVIEVHISNIYTRELFRSRSYLSKAAVDQVIGKGLDGYRLGILRLLSI